MLANVLAHRPVQAAQLNVFSLQRLASVTGFVTVISLSSIFQLSLEDKKALNN